MQISTDQQVIEPGGGYFETIEKKAVVESFFAAVTDNPLAYAFKKKTVIHAGITGEKVSGEKISEVWTELGKLPRSGKTLVYIHVPFCETRCLYCGFYANPTIGDFSRVYTDALIREIRSESDKSFCCNGGPIHGVYLGGGTPTALDGGDLKRLLQAVAKYLPLANDCEITVEGRVLNLDQARIFACLEGGANRFSIGVQTFDTDIRKKLGRVADRKAIIAALERVKVTDNAAVIIDLIYGLPGQTMEKWEEDIRTCLDLELDGVDLYQLIVHKNGLLEKKSNRERYFPWQTPPNVLHSLQGALI